MGVVTLHSSHSYATPPTRTVTLAVLAPHPAKLQSKLRVGDFASPEMRPESGSVPRAGAAGPKSDRGSSLKACASPSFALPVLGKCRLPGSEQRNGSPSHANVMRLARVIIKLKSGQELVEFLAADKLRVAFLGRRNTICADAAGINGALTNQC